MICKDIAGLPLPYDLNSTEYGQLQIFMVFSKSLSIHNSSVCAFRL